MKILAIDHGSKRIGIAISDETRTLARPLPHLAATPQKELILELKKLTEQERISLILVGLPRNMDGSHGPASAKVKDFVELLRGALEIKIETVDERLSTVQAGRMLHESGHDSRAQRKIIDSAAAVVLLQSYLDCHPSL